MMMMTFCLFKNNYPVEPYCQMFLPFKHRSALSKFQYGIAALRLETGRCSGIVDGVAECEDPDQTATIGTGWSGCALFAQICMSKSIGSLGYSYLVVKFLLLVLL